MFRKKMINEKDLPVTGGLAQSGQWLARKFVQIWKFCARPNGSGSPVCAKPLERCTQARTVQQDNETENLTLNEILTVRQGHKRSKK